MSMGKIKVILWGMGGLMLVFLLFFMYQMLQNPSGNSVLIVLMLVIGLLLGAVIVFFGTKRLSSENTVVKESSHTIAESMRKVFKIVTAEGHFNEIYDYEESTKLFKFIPSKKKALVIVQAKVLVGYDFEKLQWELDEENRKVRLINFPTPEILSTETDYKYYNIEEQFFNLFSKDDLAKIQQNSKQQVIEAAKKSHLPDVAAKQMKMLLTELLESKNWFLEDSSKISESKKYLNFSSEMGVSK